MPCVYHCQIYRDTLKYCIILCIFSQEQNMKNQYRCSQCDWFWSVVLRSYTFHCLMRILAVRHVIYLSYTTIRNILIAFHGSFCNTVILTSRLNMLLLSRSQDSHVSLSAKKHVSRGHAHVWAKQNVFVCAATSS